MNPFYNLPPEQRELQRRVDRNNADETLWRKLAPRRRLRRKLLRVLGKRALHELDLREHAAARPPEDGVGQWQPPPAQPRREIGFHAIGKKAADDGKAKSKRQLKP